jgi:hypothetical protein
MGTIYGKRAKYGVLGAYIYNYPEFESREKAHKVHGQRSGGEAQYETDYQILSITCRRKSQI